MHLIFFCIVLSLIPACFSFFLDYCLGHPGQEQINSKAILFGWSYYLAKRRVDRNQMNGLVMAFKDLLNSDDPTQRAQGQSQLKLTVFVQGRNCFTYEQAFGMCLYCTNFWISQITALTLFMYVPGQTPGLYFLLIPIFSHSILRKHLNR